MAMRVRLDEKAHESGFNAEVLQGMMRGMLEAIRTVFGDVTDAMFCEAFRDFAATRDGAWGDSSGSESD